MYPSAGAGSESTYVCDICNYYYAGVVLLVGGSFAQTQYHGAFFLTGNYPASLTNADIGCRLQKLP